MEWTCASGIAEFENEVSILTYVDYICTPNQAPVGKSLTPTPRAVLRMSDSFDLMYRQSTAQYLLPRNTGQPSLIKSSRMTQEFLQG